MKIVIIDNYDSFTYNLSHLVKELGAEVTVYRNDQFQLNQLEVFDKIIFAAMMNSHGKLTFGIGNTISFLRSAKEGDVLTAEATEVFNHHKIPYCEVKITNQDGCLVCTMTGTAYRKDVEMPFDGLM